MKRAFFSGKSGNGRGNIAVWLNERVGQRNIRYTKSPQRSNKEIITQPSLVVPVMAQLSDVFLDSSVLLKKFMQNLMCNDLHRRWS
jgi:hypothetical protein